MKTTIISVGWSLVSSGLLTAALIFFAKNWISQRIKSSIEHEYAEKLESFKARLKMEHELAIERLKASNAENQAVQAAATVSLTAVHAVAQEKKLRALETLWNATVQVGAKAPTAVSMIDILVPEEYGEFLTNPKITPLLDQLTLETLAENFKSVSNDVESSRLYTGEYLFVLFWAYRAVIGRISVLLMEGKKKGEIKDWAKDSGIRQLMSSVLSEPEIEKFDALKFGRINWLRNQIEQKILSHSSKVISGEASAEFGLEQAHKIASAARALDSTNVR